MKRLGASVQPVQVQRTKHLVGSPLSPQHRTELSGARYLVIEERTDGYFLMRYSADGGFGGDTWHQSMNDAQDQAGFEFGTTAIGWTEIPEDLSDPVAYLIDRNPEP